SAIFAHTGSKSRRSVWWPGSDVRPGCHPPIFSSPDTPEMVRRATAASLWKPTTPNHLHRTKAEWGRETEGPVAVRALPWFGRRGRGLLDAKAPCLLLGWAAPRARGRSPHRVPARGRHFGVALFPPSRRDSRNVLHPDRRACPGFLGGLPSGFL